MADLVAPGWDADTLGHDLGLSFHREYMGRFPEPLREEIIAEGLWADYYLQTEQFDQVVCNGRRNGVAVPADGGEHRLIIQNAARKRAIMMEKARRLGVSKAQMAASCRVVNQEVRHCKGRLTEETLEAIFKRMELLLEGAYG